MTQHESPSLQMNTVSMVDVTGKSVVELTGIDAQDFLHRLSTNDLSKLAIGDVVQTVLTNEKGRIVDVISVLKRTSETLLLVGQTQGGESLRQWLERYIIMEDIRVQNVTNDYTHVLLYADSPGLPDHIRTISHNAIQLDPLFQQGKTAVTFTERWGNTELQHILCPREWHDALSRILEDQGIAFKNTNEFEFFRISNGIPAYPNELSTEYNPLEAGLVAFVSFTKGCYIGQEVIARLDTYKKVQRTIVRLRMGALPLTLPQRLFSSNEEVGMITSAASSPQSQEVRGLAFIKTTHQNTSSVYFLKNDQKVIAQIEN